MCRGRALLLTLCVCKRVEIFVRLCQECHAIAAQLDELSKAEASGKLVGERGLMAMALCVMCRMPHVSTHAACVGIALNLCRVHAAVFVWCGMRAACVHGRAMSPGRQAAPGCGSFVPPVHVHSL